MTRTLRVVATLVMLVCFPLRALAVECAQPEGATGTGVSAKSASERLAYIAQLLTQETKASQRYMTVYGTSYLGLAAAQLALIPVMPEADAPVWYWGAVNALIGFAAVMLLPPTINEHAPKFAQRVQGVRDDEACALVEEGERLLKVGFEEQSFQRGWLMHTGNALLGVGFALLLGFGYRQWVSGVVNGLVSIAIGELMLWTQPSQLIPGWKAYLTGQQTPVTFHVVPTAGPGLGLVMRF